MGDLPLESVRVIDLSQVYAGPTCAAILCYLGAQVIKVESTVRMDLIRNVIIADNDGRDDYWNHSGNFLFRNAGKRSLTLDLNQEKGVELFKRLVPLSDVIVESFTPRVLRNFGLDYPSLCQLRPDLIMVSLSGYGQSGPWSDYGAYGTGLEAASGICSITGYRGDPPLRTGISFTDPLSGVTGAGAVLMALHYRRRTGRGQHIDLSEHEAAIPLMGQALMEYVMNGRLWPRLGNRSPLAAPQGCYRCRGADNWLVISVGDDTQWQAFCEAVDHPEWAADERFADLLSRHGHHDQLDALIETWTKERDHIEAMHLLQRVGVTAAAVLNPKQVLFDPHLRERGAFDSVEQPGVGRRPVPRPLGARFSAFPFQARGPAPRLGEHNREVLQGLLAVSDEELQLLEKEKVIGTEPELAWGTDVARQVVPMPLHSFQQMGAVLAVEADYQEQLGVNKEQGSA
jgi:crotonobetainyl-CoA:carnitine CoA-transferase CaiB-like acyl-CoA transferase